MLANFVRPSSGSTRSSVTGGVSHGRRLQLRASLTALCLLDVRLQAEADTQATRTGPGQDEPTERVGDAMRQGGGPGRRKVLPSSALPSVAVGAVQTFRAPSPAPKADKAPRLGSRTQSILFQMVLGRAHVYSL